MPVTAASLRTNRDLYTFVSELARAQEHHPRSLECYLGAIRAIAQAGAFGEALPLPRFAALLVEAFDHPVAPEEQSPAAPAPGEASGRAAWEARIAAQIADLRGMAAAGTLADEMRYFGVDASSGARWYNFTPSAYLEASAVGAFGGREPAELERPVVELPEIDWAQFTDFLECGALYE